MPTEGRLDRSVRYRIESQAFYAWVEIDLTSIEFLRCHHKKWQLKLSLLVVVYLKNVLGSGLNLQQMETFVKGFA